MAAPRYPEGAKLQIRRHLPPCPFRGSYGPNPRPKVTYPEGNFDRVDFALANPPVKTEPQSTDRHTFTITSTKTLRCFDDGGGAHVITGYVDQWTTVYVAKIYDGVDYPFEEDEDGIDCMTLADADYAVEGCAYETMQGVATVAGNIAPNYYGGWTFPVDTDDARPPRWVRMILIELIEGETMLAKILRATKNDTIVYSLLPSEEFRLRVLKNIFEAEIAIWWDAEVEHIDVNPRNVMMRDDGRVVLIDFNQTMIYPYLGAAHPKHGEDDSPLPPSPIRRYWKEPFADSEEDGGPWGNWIPKAWLNNKELAVEWLLDTWGNPPPDKYEPLSSRFLNDPAHAKRSAKILRKLEKLGRKPAEKT